MDENLEKLFVRCDAAIAEVRRLVAENLDLAAKTTRTVTRRYARSKFGPSDRNKSYPQDFREKRPT